MSEFSITFLSFVLINEELPKIIRTDMVSVCKHFFEIPQSYFVRIDSNYFVEENRSSHCVHFVTYFSEIHFGKLVTDITQFEA